MSTADWMATHVRRAGEWANPILVKETRQSLKSRQFVSTFLLLLLASWVGSMAGVLWSGEAMEYGRAGRDFFAMFYTVLAIAVLVVVPFGAFLSLLGERDENTWELLSITALTPRQIVWGKWLNSLMQVFIYYSAIAPFIAFTSLLQGFDFAQVTYLLALLLIVSMGYSMTALMLSTQARQKQAQAFMTLGMLVLVGNGFFGFIGIVFSALAFVPFDSREFWIANAVALLVFVSYFILFLQIATANLTFESDNRSTGIRLTLSAQFWLFWIVGIGLYYYFSPSRVLDAETLAVMTSISAIHWTIAGMIATTESNALSRRIRRGLPQRSGLRLLLAPFLPGGSRGFLYVLIHIIALWGIVVLLVPALFTIGPWYTSGSASGAIQYSTLGPLFTWFGEIGMFTTVLCYYMVIYLGMSTSLSRVAQKVASDIKPGHTRFATALVALFLLLIPLIGRLVEWIHYQDFVFLDLLNPFTTISEVTGGSHSVRWIFSTLTVAAAIAVLINLKGMWRGVMEIVRDPFFVPASDASEASSQVPEAKTEAAAESSP